MRIYVEENRIGLNPLGVGDYKVDSLIDRMKESSKVMGSRYELPGIGIVIERGQRRKYAIK